MVPLGKLLSMTDTTLEMAVRSEAGVRVRRLCVLVPVVTIGYYAGHLMGDERLILGELEPGRWWFHEWNRVSVNVLVLGDGNFMPIPECTATMTYHLQLTPLPELNPHGWIWFADALPPVFGHRPSWSLRPPPPP